MGGGSRGTGGTITISDGEITATAGNEGGSGIGGGLYAAGGTITIGGATIVAKGGAGGAGIGGGHQSAAGAASTITLNGGTVTATGGSGTPQGIGYGSAAGSATATVTINGGSVKASSISPTPKNSANTAVSLKTLTFNGISAVTAVTAGTIGGTACAAAPNAAGGIFGIKNVKTDTTGKVYFYLPQTSVPPVSLTIDAGVYENSNSANLSMLYLRASAPAPTVVEVTSSNVGVAGTITTTFSTAMDTATAGTVRLNDKVTLAGGSWSNGNKTYAVTYLGLDYSTTYNVSISGFKSAAGIEMVALPNAYSFTTAAKTAV
ncbi:MAG: Ig-like domain-containing protein, partial [Coriobacteriales bacterium]|nr:Ig-like domain-containing protein [Coriobacteriales bacterium]